MICYFSYARMPQERAVFLNPAALEVPMRIYAKR
jgi:hypothetical protein